MASKNNKVNGGFMVLLGKRVGDSVFMPILCQTTLSLGRQLNTIDASSKCGKDIAIDEEDGTVTMEGFMLKAGLTDILTSKDVEDLYKTQDEADFMIGVVDPAGKSGAVSYRFSGVITQKQLTMNNNEKSKSSITITTTTPVETGVILPSGAILWDSDAKTSGYTFDWGTFLGALNADLPASYQAEAELLLAPGITKTGMIAGVNKSGQLVEFTATRAGAATYIGKDGLLKTAAADEPRIDWSDGSARYLIESASTNIVKYSNSIGNDWWIKSGITAVDNSALSPDGTLNASLLTITSGESSFIRTLGKITVTEGVKYSFSFYAKKGTKKNGYKYAIVDGDSGVYLKGVTDYSNLISSTEYTRITTTILIPTGTSSIHLFALSESNSVGGTCNIFGLQLEAKISPTSLIYTNGSDSVRASDMVHSNGDIAGYTDLSMFIDTIGYSGNSYLVYKTTSSIYFYSNLTNTDMAVVDQNSSTTPIMGSKFISTFDTNKNIFSNGVSGAPTIKSTTDWGSSNLIILGGSGASKIYIKTLAVFSRKFADQEAKDLTK